MPVGRRRRPGRQTGRPGDILFFIWKSLAGGPSHCERLTCGAKMEEGWACGQTGGRGEGCGRRGPQGQPAWADDTRTRSRREAAGGPNKGRRGSWGQVWAQPVWYCTSVCTEHGEGEVGERAWRTGPARASTYSGAPGQTQSTERKSCGRGMHACTGVYPGSTDTVSSRRRRTGPKAGKVFLGHAGPAGARRPPEPGHAGRWPTRRSQAWGRVGASVMGGVEWCSGAAVQRCSGAVVERRREAVKPKS